MARQSSSGSRNNRRDQGNPGSSNGSIELPGSSEKTRLEDEQNLRDLEAAHGIAAAGQSDGAPPTRAAAGWRPWKVMIGCFCLTVPTYGLLSSIGLFQTYWHEHMLQGYSESEISWIISVFGFLTCLFASPAGIVFDRYGSAWLLPTGSVAYIVSFIGLTFSSTYQELMGCMTLAGVAAAIPTTIAFSVISQWFQAGAGVPAGFVSLGAALGGIFFSMVLQVLFQNFQWKSAALILTAILACFLLVGNILVKTNAVEQAADNNEGYEPTKIADMLRSPKFWLVSYALFAYELVLFIQWGSIPSYAVSAQVGSIQFYLMMSYNIGAVFGRTVPPYVSDRKLGSINTTILMNIFTLLVVLVIWLPFGGSSTAVLFLAIVLMGFGTGSFVPLGVSCINALCTPQTAGTWIGSVYSVVSFATLIGNPASAAILAQYKPSGLVGFLAAVLFSGLVSVGALRWLCHGRRWILKARV